MYDGQVYVNPMSTDWKVQIKKNKFILIDNRFKIVHLVDALADIKWNMASLNASCPNILHLLFYTAETIWTLF